jgi:hypothetical protein
VWGGGLLGMGFRGGREDGMRRDGGVFGFMIPLCLCLLLKD